jgi:hypothetical protein
MKEIRIKAQSKLKRCEIYHQTDMFEQDKELCLRCGEIIISISKEDLKNSFVDKNKLVLIPERLNPIYISILALIVTIIAHLPLIFVVTVTPPFYSGVVAFVTETFIACFALRWRKDFALGVFAGIGFSVGLILLSLVCHPFNVLVSHCGGRH